MPISIHFKINNLLFGVLVNVPIRILKIFFTNFDLLGLLAFKLVYYRRLFVYD